MKKIIYILLIALIGITYSCEDSYIDGGLADPNVNKTTVDFLKEHGKFDTIMYMMEKADLLDEINRTSNTVVIPTDYSVVRYVEQWKIKVQKEMNDENYPFTFDSLMVRFPEFRDSLSMYILPQSINRVDLEKKSNYSVIIESQLGNEVQMALKETLLYTEWLPNNKNHLLHYTWVINGLDPEDTEGMSEEDLDKGNTCQTSGLITTTGILHVLEDAHNLFFNEWPATVSN